MCMGGVAYYRVCRLARALTIDHRYVLGEVRIGMFALKNIPAGEELCIDYNYEQIGIRKQECYCGSPKCRGYIAPTKVDKVCRILHVYVYVYELPVTAYEHCLGSQHHLNTTPHLPSFRRTANTTGAPRAPGGPRRLAKRLAEA